MRLALLFFFLSAVLFAQDASPELILEPITNLRRATDIASRPGDTSTTLYIAEKRGRIVRYSGVDGEATDWFDISNRVDADREGGLLGLAFHPEADSNYVFLNYTRPGTDGSALTTVVSRFTLDGAFPVATSERVLLTINQPAANHNAGDIAFGPDGYLYITSGDGGGSNDRFGNGQNPLTLLGAILRIDVDRPTEDLPYSIPANNPFVGSPDTLDEIWALGLRNPWRLSFDRLTGDLWIGDVGQGQREEINFQPAGSSGGQNYGWNCREGFVEFTSGPQGNCEGDRTNYTAPIVDYPHRDTVTGLDGESVTGGFVYRGPYPGLRGYYVFGDFVRQRLYLFRPVDGNMPADTIVYTDLATQSISTFGEGSDGRLYVADYGGQIYEITTNEQPVSNRPNLTGATLNIYPNPTSDHLAVTLPQGFGRVRRAVLTDLAGRRIFEWTTISSASGELRLRLPARIDRGVYLLSLEGDRTLATGRMVVDR